MKYYAVTFEINNKHENSSMIADLIAAMMGDLGFESFEEKENGTIGYIQQKLFNTTYIDQTLQTTPLANFDIRYLYQEAPDENWNECYEAQGFNPIEIYDICIVYDANKGIDLQKYKDIPFKISIKQEMAFGDGTHTTTEMMLETLFSQDNIQGNVLDCGCGTGILSIAAALQGANKVCAYDIDEWSTKNTIHNAAANNISKIEVLEGDVSVVQQFGCKFDWILANLNRNIILQDLSVWLSVLNPGGHLLISGFYEKPDADILKQEIEKQGLKLWEQGIKNRWCLLLFRKV